MQSGGGGGRNPAVGPAGRTASTSSAASPSSSSSSVQQQQQIACRQSLQQQLRKSDGNEATLAYQAGGIQGIMGGSHFALSPGSVQLTQQARKFLESHQQHGSSQEGEKGSNPVHQAYLQHAFWAQQQKSSLPSHQQARMGMVGSASVKDQDTQMGMLKLQQMISKQAANLSQASSSKISTEQFACGGKQMEKGSDHRNEPKPLPQQALMPANIVRSMPPLQAQQGIHNMGNSSITLAQQWQAMQTWAIERKIDLSNPSNANQLAQLLQARLAAQQKANEGNMPVQPSSIPVSKQTATSSMVPGDSSPHANSPSDISGQSGSVKTRTPVSSGPFGSTSSPWMINPAKNPSTVQGRDNAVHPRQPVVHANAMPPLHLPKASGNVTEAMDQHLSEKNAVGGPQTPEMQCLRQLNSSSSSSVVPSDASPVNNFLLQGGQGPQQHFGFTKQQLHVLKAQILAFRRLKKGEGTLPQELLQAISPPPFEIQLKQEILLTGGSNQDRSSGKMGEDQSRHLDSTKESQAVLSTNGQTFSKEEANVETKATVSTSHRQGFPTVEKEAASVAAATKEEYQTDVFSVNSDHGMDQGLQKTTTKSDSTADKGKGVAPQPAISDAGHAKKPVQASPPQQPKDTASARKYYGPLFDFPSFTRKHDSYGSATPNTNNNLSLAYHVKDLLFEEGVEFLNKKRTENLKKISGLLAINLERKRIRPDLVLQLQIEEKKLRLVNLQARIRDEVDKQQQEIMTMPDRPYRKFVRLCERQRLEMARQVQANQKAVREKQLKSIFQWRKKFLEAHWGIRDARTARNRGVAKYHEKMLREFSKRKDDDRNRRMEALKNNDVERYREMLLEQQTSMPGDAAERYAVLSSFLAQTEEYLHKLGSKITSAKDQQEVEEAAAAAAAAARLQGLSEEEVRAAAACAGEEVTIRNRFMEMNAPKDGSSVSKYYSLAHAVNERVLRQPSMLKAGTLRDYQLVGLQWMLSLYNNKLNGILADEMGLGKTVQVMALIAYLMEFKGNYGPHLIIVPNAVLVNWKSEFHNWLPSVSCIFYVGAKDQRSKLFSQVVCAMKFNVLVTTYEFIMYDRSKLSKIEWKYIIIDEAQRMKDRESVLARDLDRYRCQRRLLLTGTPLQNDLKELWSLLNLLLPEVFDNRKAFHDWFSQPFQKEGPTHNGEDDWLETEKKIIIIHRLHQILEPFMLRRRVEDVEGSLPPKVSIVLKCRMSAIQSAIYDWIKSTGTLRVDPEDEKRRAQKNPIYQVKTYRTLNNRCMELRKACNHPLLNYPYFSDFSKDFLVRSCGKLWILDRILIKLQRTGHRVLLFSTMTKLLDILEEYLQWRRLVYRRIDGTTSLEDRESAIVDFNDPDTDCFIFLLSIRAAGRGLNLQTADTVIIYDPDPNPKNEEQAVARAHRIGQTREVKVIYMEAVVDNISSHQKEDELRSGGSTDYEDDLAGKDRYMGSIESLIRNNIQQYKIDMADEVINAGRFDQRTTHEERRMTLETLLHDEERYQETVHDVPSLHEVNRLISRSEAEVELFDQMDEELEWTAEMTCHEQVPKWLRVSTKEVNAATASLSKKPSKNILYASNLGVQSGEVETERKRGRPKGKKVPKYKELDDGNGGSSDASYDEEKNGYSVNEEEGEIGDFVDDEFSGAPVAPQNKKDESEEDDGPVCDGGYDYPRDPKKAKDNQILDEAVSSGSSPKTGRSKQPASPVSLQKFGFLSALDSRPGSVSKRLSDELEEGEIAASGDSYVDCWQSGSWMHEHDEGEEEQVLQPKKKGKRSIRLRPRHTMERPDEKYSSELPVVKDREPSPIPFQMERNYKSTLRTSVEPHGPKHDQSDASSKLRRSLPARRIANTSKLHGSPKSGRFNSVQPEDADEASRESWDGKSTSPIGSSNTGAGMSEIIQRRCKNVISKLQKRIEKEGQQIVPMLTNLWKRTQNSNYTTGGGNNLLVLREIDHRVETLEYTGVMELVSDVQIMLKNAIQFYGFSPEVRSEARKVHNLFFDILKIAFPDRDFRGARNVLSFSGPMLSSASTSSPRQTSLSQGKRQKVINEVEPELTSPQRPQQKENTRIRVQIPQKETRLVGKRQPDDSQMPAHPGELVVCKKKRKEREKSAMKTRPGVSIGPVSPPTVMGQSLGSPGPGLGHRETRLARQTTQQQSRSNQTNSGGGEAVGWANPVKRLRTDAGKRRPSHL